MSELKQNIAIRKKMKSKKPDFERQDSNKYKSFKGKWRRQRGLHNKMRNAFRGNKFVPAVGYGSPKGVEGLTSQGLRPFLVHNTMQLGNIDKDCVVVISRRVGMRKRLEILKQAKEKKIAISGVREFDTAITKINNIFEERKKRKTSLESVKKKELKSVPKTGEGTKEYNKDESKK